MKWKIGSRIPASHLENARSRAENHLFSANTVSGQSDSSLLSKVAFSHRGVFSRLDFRCHVSGEPVGGLCALADSMETHQENTPKLLRRPSSSCSVVSSTLGHIEIPPHRDTQSDPQRPEQRLCQPPRICGEQCLSNFDANPSVLIVLFDNLSAKAIFHLMLDKTDTKLIF